jgi:predicted metalloprotease with PDZ domain
VDLVLNLTLAEHKIDQFIFQQSKMVKNSIFLFKISFIFYSSGSPADKAGLCIDDEIISINDEKIENLTFDQVRKILKERNLRGSIKLVVRTFEGKLN